MSQPQSTEITSRVAAILRSTGGNFLEMFDFFLFGFYASYISQAFFPSSDETTALLKAFTVFWMGALMRPVGAIVLGAYIDRIGRRRGLIVTLGIMAMGTICIAFSPTYAQIGIAAPIIVLVGRLLQGFSAGVELGGVSVYLAEISTPGNKGFYTSFQSASQQVAIFIAAIIGYVMNATLTTQQIATGGGSLPFAGWRIPFFIGCLIVPLIFWLRRSLQESPEFLAQKKHPTTGEIFESMVENIDTVLLGMLLVVLTTVTFYLITVYTPTFGKNVLKLSESDALTVTLCVAVSNFIWLPIGGAISDRIGRKPVLLTIAALAFLTAYPALAWLVQAPSFKAMLAVELLFSMYFGVYNGAMVAALTEVVPPHVRATGFSLAFSLANALFGTATPAVSTWLIANTGDKASPGYWLMFAGACGIVSSLALYRAGRRNSVAATAGA
jgi:MFS transporter, MHS family, citrate/tricarballylate:H+ symporter